MMYPQSSDLADVRVSRVCRPPLPFEVVERKGVGHPDTLADAIAEELSRTYSQYVHKAFGGYAHHWFDKVILIGAEASLGYGSGTLSRPFEAILLGKCVLEVGAHKIPLLELFEQAAAAVLTRHLYRFDPSRHLHCEVRVSSGRGPGQSAGRYRPAQAADLVHVLGRGVSNDCNLCVGFAPLSPIELMVLTAEHYLSEPEYRLQHGSGTDIKVVGTRQNSQYEMLVNLPFLADFVSSRQDYLARVAQAQEQVVALLRTKFDLAVEVVVNPEKEAGRSYLTATGSVLDTGDIGVVGRGNRLNGLITPTRPMSIEASCGKNPLDHTGKLYGIAAHRAALRVFEELGEANEVYLIAAKEKPLSQSLQAQVFLTGQSAIAAEPQSSGSFPSSTASAEAARIVQTQLGNFPALISELLDPGIAQW